MSSNKITEAYISGLMQRVSEEDRRELSYAYGATDNHLAELVKKYPHCPDSLLTFLKRINGTYYQQYGENEISVLILGSDVSEYPYYLKSVEQILEQNHFTTSIRELYGEYLEKSPEILGVGINPDVSLDKWLCFSDCMNNGGTSCLFVDFNPGPGGNVGQVVRFLHDPDSFKVIANNFDSYIQMLINNDYDFIHIE